MLLQAWPRVVLCMEGYLHAGMQASQFNQLHA